MKVAKIIKEKFVCWLVLCGMILIFGCAGKPPGPAIYTAYNMWYEHPERMSCLNYKVGARLPAGTEVKSVTVKKNNIYLTIVNDDRSFRIQFQPRFHPGKSIYDFRDEMITTRTFNEMVQGMTEAEIDSIRNGMITPGMSKEAVLISYGPPPEHKTPSLLSNVWVYWITRHGNRNVVFGEDNRTTR